MPRKEAPKHIRDIPLAVYLTEEEAEILGTVSDFLQQPASAIATVAVERLLIAFKPIAYALELVRALDRCREGVDQLLNKNNDLVCYLDNQYRGAVDRLQELGFEDLVESLLKVYEFVDTSELQDHEDKSERDIAEDILEGLKNWEPTVIDEPPEEEDENDDEASHA